jgi:hypothetical protein
MGRSGGIVLPLPIEAPRYGRGSFGRECRHHGAMLLAESIERDEE